MIVAMKQKNKDKKITNVDNSTSIDEKIIVCSTNILS